MDEGTGVVTIVAFGRGEKAAVVVKVIWVERVVW